jgi:hypothetical protein
MGGSEPETFVAIPCADTTNVCERSRTGKDAYRRLQTATDGYRRRRTNSNAGVPSLQHLQPINSPITHHDSRLTVYAHSDPIPPNPTHGHDIFSKYTDLGGRLRHRHLTPSPPKQTILLNVS